MDALAGQFSESGAENYLEMHFHSDVTGPLVATLQRVNGKTPHQLREAAEKERDQFKSNWLECLTLAEEAKPIIDRQRSEIDALRVKIEAMEKRNERP